MIEFDWRKAVTQRGSRLPDFQDLMQQRVQDIVLVASPYDSFILEEDGQLYELILSEFLELDLRHTPGLHRVSSGAGPGIHRRLHGLRLPARLGQGLGGPAVCRRPFREPLLVGIRWQSRSGRRRRLVDRPLRRGRWRHDASH